MCAINRLNWMSDELESLDSKSQRRELRTVSSENGAWIEIDSKRCLNLSSNNYLGISFDARLQEGWGAASSSFALGATASRLVVGNNPVMDEVEKELAESKGAEASLIFSNGYMANVGILSSIAGRNDAIFSDRINHASIVDGIILSRAEHHRYRHRDVEHLEFLLKKAPAGQKKIIVTDSIFSMDGDIAPLAELVALKERYGAIMMVDEAHSGGIYGEHGEGLVHELGLHNNVEIIMGTFSKAYGCYGAYVTGSRLLIDYLVNKARSFIYSTALPPAVFRMIQQAMRAVKEEGWRREHLRANALYFRQALEAAGFDTLGSQTQIVPICLGDNQATLEFSARLYEEGVAGVAIRPPTVPEGRARIRFSVMATHGREDLTWAVKKISDIAREMNIR